MHFQLSPCIAINIRQYEKAIAFYRDVLGFEVVKYSPRETHFRKGNTQFFIELDEARAGKVFFEFEVENFAEAEKLLREQGCQLISPFSPRNAMFSDAFGMNFHVYEKGLDLPGVEG